MLRCDHPYPSCSCDIQLWRGCKDLMQAGPEPDKHGPFPTLRKSEMAEAAVRDATVLIVEDDSVFAYAVKRHLERYHFRVICVESSIEALKQFDTEDIDVLIADVRLLEGEPHGLSLARTLRTQRPKLSVILVTAYPELLEGERALPGLVLNKPFELATLRDAIRACLRR
jgi:CheY-like chemotaxis protein